ncbi:hypothetical protein [Roseobacter fucihabitans]|uniref:hypothetical protein n=1 Tax=Roseobacter fucihabitans TaxID=1537242 RepID=UPI0030CA8752
MMTYSTSIKEHLGQTCGMWGHDPEDATVTTLAFEDVEAAVSTWHKDALTAVNVFQAENPQHPGFAVAECRGDAPSYWAVAQPIFPRFRQVLPKPENGSDTEPSAAAFGFSAYRLNSEDCQATVERAKKQREAM